MTVSTNHSPAKELEVDVSPVIKIHKDVDEEEAKASIKATTVDKDGSADDKEDKKVEITEMVSFTELFQFATNYDICLMVLGSFGIALQGAIFPVFSVIFGDLLDAFAEPDIVDAVLEQCLNFVYLAIISFIGSGIGLSCWMYVAEALSLRLREKYIESLLRQHLGFLETFKGGELTSALENDLKEYVSGIGEKVCTAIMHTVTILLSLTLGFYYGWHVALVVLAMVPFIACMFMFLAKVMSADDKGSQESYGKAGAVATEVLAAITTVTAFTTQNKEYKRYLSYLTEAQAFGIKKGRASGIGSGAINLVFNTVYGVSLWFGVLMIRTNVYNPGVGGPYTGGSVMSVFFSLIIGAMSIGQLGPCIEKIISARTAMFRLLSIVNHKSTIDALSDEGRALTEDELKGAIEFKNVKFAYPTRPDYQVFDDFSLKIPAGKCVALVGESGSGKSTVVGLVQRFYDVLAGQVLVDGVDIKELRVNWWRQHVAVVSQEPVLFDGSIRDNIAYGKLDATDAEVTAAAKLAFAHDFIMDFGGYSASVGEGGKLMSGGQKQRIAIARAAIMKPSVLLLDEATSALDNESEQIVQKALASVMETATSIVIAHRLSTVRNADVICVVERGVIVEKGNHEELMALEGQYTALVNKQATRGGVTPTPTPAPVETKESKDNAPLSPKAKRKSSGLALETAEDKDGDSKSESLTDEEKELHKKELHAIPISEIWQYTEGARGHFALGLIGAFVAGGLYPAFSFLFGELVGVFYETDEDKQERLSIQWGLAFVVLGVILFLGDVLKGDGLARVGQTITLRVRALTFRTMLRLEMGYFDEPRHHSRALCTRLATDASKIQAGTTERIGLTAQAVLMLAVSIGMSLYYSWQLSLLVVVILPILGAASAIHMKLLAGFHDSASAALEEAGKISGMAVANITTVNSFCTQKQVLKQYAASLVLPFLAARKRALSGGFGFGLSNSAFLFCYAVCFYVGALLIEDGEMEFSAMIKVVFALMMAGSVLGQISNGMSDLQEARDATAEIFHILNRISKIDPEEDDNGVSMDAVRINGFEIGSHVYSSFVQEAPDAAAVTKEGGDIEMGETKVQRRDIVMDKGEIEFRDVVFAYPINPGLDILQGFSLKIESGTAVALSGTSGSGKSTLVSLLLRFYDISSGSLLIDGHDIRSYSLSSLRSQVAWVKQEPVLMEGTVLENIRYGKADATLDEVKAACEEANAWHFIQQLPDGLNTEVGVGGGSLSGGQKQRIAIARALIRKPKILLLDEATSALDSDSESVVQAALDKIIASKVCTVVSIAHRINTIQNSDAIAFMHKGRVKELGTHNELMAMGGAYADMVNTSA